MGFSHKQFFLGKIFVDGKLILASHSGLLRAVHTKLLTDGRP